MTDRCLRGVRVGPRGVLFVLLLVCGLLPAGAGEIEPLTVDRPLGRDGIERGRYSERTLVVGIEADRSEARILSYTLKDQPFVSRLVSEQPRSYETGKPVQVEITLLGPRELRHTRRVDAGYLCLDHGPDAEPHVEGDTIRMHRDSFLVRLPEIAGFDRMEIAVHERGRAGPERKLLVRTKLEREDFSPAGGTRRFDDLLFAVPGRKEPAPAPAASTVIWPENLFDPDIYRVEGDAAEGPKRINIVIVPDGYTYAEKALMDSHANAMIAHFRNKTPLEEHDPLINYTLVYAYSSNSGTDQCDCGIEIDTAMGSRFPTGNGQCGHSANRCLSYGGGCGSSGTSNIVAAELRAPYHDQTVLMVNTTRYGGCGGSRATFAAGNGSATEVAIHELGHSLAGLADEYGGNSSCGSYGGEINTSLDPIDGAWPEWFADLGSPIEGGRYYDQCIFRPEPNCDMRSLNQPFCPVCNQRWTLVTFGHPRVRDTAPIESMDPVSPLSAWVGVPVEFSVSTRLASGPGVTNSVTWSIDGPGYIQPTAIAWDTENHTHAFAQAGQYELSAAVVGSTNFVKPERWGDNMDVVTWTVDVTLLLPPSEVSPPAAVDPLRFDDRQTLRWEDASGMGAWVYNLYRGVLGGLPGGAYGSCLAPGITGTVTVATADPPAGVGWIYLVAGANPAGEGPLGHASSGAGRTIDTSCGLP